MMIISRWIFNRFGWGMAALITPTVLLITGERQWGARMHALCAGARQLSPGVRWRQHTPPADPFRPPLPPASQV